MSVADEFAHPETMKLRGYMQRLEHVHTAPMLGRCTAYDEEHERYLVAMVMGQSVLAQQEQLVDYQRTVRGSEVVQCRVCHGRGKSYTTRDPGSGEGTCSACGGSGLVRV